MQTIAIDLNNLTVKCGKCNTPKRIGTYGISSLFMNGTLETKCVQCNDELNIVKKDLNESTYYLFGTEACNTYDSMHIDYLLRECDEKEWTLEVFKFTQNVTSPTELLEAFVGNEKYIEITELEYNKIILQNNAE